MVNSGPSMKYLIRIMQVLMEYESISITNIAMLARINHKRCSVVLTWLEAAQFVNAKVSGSKKFYSLSPSGFAYGIKLLEINRDTSEISSSTDKMYVQNVSEL